MPTAVSATAMRMKINAMRYMAAAMAPKMAHTSRTAIVVAAATINEGRTLAQKSLPRSRL